MRDEDVEIWRIYAKAFFKFCFACVKLYKLFKFADRYDIVLMAVGTISAVANGLSQSFMTLVFGDIVNILASSYPSHMVEEVSKVGVKFLYLAAGTCAISFLQVSCWMVTGARQSARIRSLYLKAILRQDISFYDTEANTGEVIKRLSRYTILIQESMGEKVGKFMQLLSTSIGVYTIALIQCWKLAWRPLFLFIYTIVNTGFLMGLLVSYNVWRVQVAYKQAGNKVEQAVKAITTEDGEYIYHYLFFKKSLDSLPTKTPSCMFHIFKPLCRSLKQTLTYLHVFGTGQAVASKMFETINRRPKIDAYDMSGEVLEEIKGDIELRDVHFRYPARPDVHVFAGFSLVVRSGTTVALVGKSGSGKSTVINLIERFYDPESGTVLIDGTDLKKLQLRWIRSKIGLVNQEPILFATTIRENISYGKEDATEQEIRAAVDLANADKFIDMLPQGLDTVVGEDGMQLSGGEKQRIAIARAVVKNPKILLFDEPTSAMNMESEGIVDDSLLKLMPNRTIVLVSHRLTTIRTANVIAVVDQGKIVEKGTHEEMIQNPKGAYSQLVHLHEGSKTVSRSKSHNRSEASFEMGGSIIRNSVSCGNQTTEKRKKMSLRWLSLFERFDIRVLFVATAVHGIAYPVQGLLLYTFITNKIFFEHPSHWDDPRKYFISWALMFGGFCLTTAAANFLQNYLLVVLEEQLIKRSRSLSFDKVFHEEIKLFDHTANSSGAIGERLSRDASRMKSMLRDSALIVQNVASVTAALLIIAFSAKWELILAVLVITPIMVLEVDFQTNFSAYAMMVYKDASQVASDAVRSIKTVVSLCAEEKVIDLYQQRCEEQKEIGARLGLVMGFGHGFFLAALYFIYFVLFYFGSVLIQLEKATFVEVLKVFFVLRFTSIGVSQSNVMALDISKVRDSIASICDILNSKQKID
ncbi:unnamed protein product [Microthlaspi erraticum]|uniref:Uncharacterized protein n=1 Tax=Microthlaspi erraticum TaxID=1685480 RepID=A0A6D2IDR5_9BRAS|nr:unnamed protein product [Microthlaspi erraticum]